MPTPRTHLPLQDCDRPAAHGAHTWRETGGQRRTYSCGGSRGRAPDATVRLRPDAFTQQALASYGWASRKAAAEAVGVAPSTMRRAIAGQIAPGERLIARLIAGTGHTFDALFTVVITDRQEDRLPV